MSLFKRVIPAMSMCAQFTFSSTNFSRKAAAVPAPAHGALPKF